MAAEFNGLCGRWLGGRLPALAGSIRPDYHKLRVLCCCTGCRLHAAVKTHQTNEIRRCTCAAACLRVNRTAIPILPANCNVSLPHTVRSLAVMQMSADHGTAQPASMDARHNAPRYQQAPTPCTPVNPLSCWVHTHRPQGRARHNPSWRRQASVDLGLAQAAPNGRHPSCGPTPTALTHCCHRCQQHVRCTRSVLTPDAPFPPTKHSTAVCWSSISPPPCGSRWCSRWWGGPHRSGRSRGTAGHRPGRSGRSGQWCQQSACRRSWSRHLQTAGVRARLSVTQ